MNNNNIIVINIVIVFFCLILCIFLFSTNIIVNSKPTNYNSTTYVKNDNI